VIVQPAGQAIDAIGGEVNECEITAPLVWLLSAWVRDTLVLSGDLVLRGAGVAVHGGLLELELDDDDDLQRLGLPSRTVDLRDPVRDAVQRSLAAVPAYAALQLRASWFVDGRAVDLAPLLAAADASVRPTAWRTLSVRRSSLRRSGVRVPSVPERAAAAAIVELVEYCAAAALGATAVIGIVSEHAAAWRLPSALPTLAGVTSVDVHTLHATVLHPRAIVALLEQMPRAPWTCLTVRCGADAVSFVCVAGSAAVHVVCCGQRARVH